MRGRSGRAGPPALAAAPTPDDARSIDRSERIYRVQRLDHSPDRRLSGHQGSVPGGHRGRSCSVHPQHPALAMAARRRRDGSLRRAQPDARGHRPGRPPGHPELRHRPAPRPARARRAGLAGRRDPAAGPRRAGSSRPALGRRARPGRPGDRTARPEHRTAAHRTRTADRRPDRAGRAARDHRSRRIAEHPRARPAFGAGLQPGHGDQPCAGRGGRRGGVAGRAQAVDRRRPRRRHRSAGRGDSAGPAGHPGSRP